MKNVIWTDGSGWRRRSALPDSYSDERAAEGVPAGPPDVRRVDWEAVMRDLNNMLVDGEVWTWDDVQRRGQQVQGAILSALKTQLVRLYREDYPERRTK
jgi:hypothetical protein